ncbi:MHO_1590 family protein [Mycoplasma enhydrae]|uniref:MHO_1590 family protein n=1 Tax=Mycoplasma enhydrae TaxID=2499220 RepID=UPI00197C4EEA|nr:hypothetical protein [Mycoplasma enhydrae]MBN4089513.1 hypothetical protein [Mycoplasma enhydrae]MCV3733642.1 hypothetical protein [Mycoplasma enhydrae]
MKERTKKILIWSSVGVILSASIAATSAFAIMQQKANKKTLDKKSNESKDINKSQNEKNELEENDKDTNNKEENNELNAKDVDWKKIFPQIQSSDYYDKLNYRNGQAWIDEDMIVYIIKDVLNRMLVSDGVVKYAYKQLDDQNLLITFKWNNQKEKSVVTYKINTNKL